MATNTKIAEIDQNDDSPVLLRSETFFMDLKFYTVGDAQIDSISKRLWEEFNEFEKIGRCRKEFFDNLKILVENIIYVGNKPLTIPLRHEYYWKIPARYNLKKVNLPRLKLILAFLESRKYIKHTKGYFNRVSGKSRYSQLEVTPKWNKLKLSFKVNKFNIKRDPKAETIILKCSKKELSDYKEKKQIRKMRSSLAWINKKSLEWTYDIKGNPIHPSYYRVFNSNFYSGARFYSPFQNLRKEDRSQLRINGESCVELDYSGIHVQMLYLKKGKPLFDGDVYLIKGFEEYRDFFKTILQICINAKSKSSAYKAINQAKRSGSDLNTVSAKELLEKFEEKHSEIKDFFYSGIGVHLQYLDAKIASNVFKLCFKQNIPVMCVHDSFITTKSNTFLLKSIMRQSSKRVLGAELKIK